MGRVVTASIACAALICALPFALAGQWVPALLSITAGIAWAGGLRREIEWPTLAGFLTLVALCGLAVLSDIEGAWALAGVVAALVAWDLTGFALRALSAGHVVEQEQLWRAHLRRAALVAAAGLAIGALALFVRVEIDFGWLLFLGLIAVVTISRLIGTLRDGA